MHEIISYLKNPNKDEINYFKSTIREYLNRAKSKKHIKKIYLVSFPHLINLKNIYEGENDDYNNVSHIIDEVLEKNSEMFEEKVSHINFTKIIISENKENKLFNYEDYLFDKIHLKQKPHKLFISEIFKRIN